MGAVLKKSYNKNKPQEVIVWHFHYSLPFTEQFLSANTKQWFKCSIQLWIFKICPKSACVGEYNLIQNKPYKQLR